MQLAAKEAEKIPTEVKIDCYTVNLLPVKTAVEEHMKNLQEALISSLRRKTAAEKAEVEEFVKHGKNALEQQFASVEEIGAARQNAKEMIGQVTALHIPGLPLQELCALFYLAPMRIVPKLTLAANVCLRQVSHVLNLRRKIEDKNKLIRQMATAIGTSSGLAGGSGAAMAGVDMSELNNEWETFQTKLQQHETHLEDQKNQLKGQIERNITEFKSKVNGFASRWQQFKPKGAPEGDPQLMLAKIEDDALSLAELLEEAKKVNQDCEHFQMDLPDFAMLEEIAADVEATKVAWSRYGEFLKVSPGAADVQAQQSATVALRPDHSITLRSPCHLLFACRNTVPIMTMVKQHAWALLYLLPSDGMIRHTVCRTAMSLLTVTGSACAMRCGALRTS